MEQLTLQELKDLALHAAKGTAPANFENADVNAAFQDQLALLGGSINKFNQNKYSIFEILIEVVDEIVPKKVIDVMGMFAEVRHVPQGQKTLFKVQRGRQRARKFLTQVGLSGVYETFRLDTATYEVGMSSIGGGVSIDFERLLDGADSLADMVDIISEAMEDAVYLEVQKALKAVVATNPALANVKSTAFSATDMQELIMKVKAYGTGAVIFAPPQFIAAMGPDAIVPPATGGGYGGVYAPQDIEAIHTRGLINLFRGTPIVEIPQSYTDENNNLFWIDPAYAYIFPTGGEKIVKVVFEGDTQMWDIINADQSIEIMVYKKLGVGIETYHNWAVYKNTGVSGTAYEGWL